MFGDTAPPPKKKNGGARTTPELHTEVGSEHWPSITLILNPCAATRQSDMTVVSDDMKLMSAWQCARKRFTHSQALTADGAVKRVYLYLRRCRRA